MKKKKVYSLTCVFCFVGSIKERRQNRYMQGGSMMMDPSGMNRNAILEQAQQEQYAFDNDFVYRNMN